MLFLGFISDKKTYLSGKFAKTYNNIQVQSRNHKIVNTIAPKELFRDPLHPLIYGRSVVWTYLPKTQISIPGYQGETESMY